MSTAKDILGGLPEAAEEADYTLENGAVLRLRGVRAYRAMRSAANAVELRGGLPNALPEDVLYALETFTSGVVEPTFTFSEALEFSDRAGLEFAGIVSRINQLSAQTLKSDVAEAKTEIESDPTSAA